MTREEGKFFSGKEWSLLHDGEYLLVKGPASFPRGIPERPEVHIPEVFHDDETAGRIMANQPGHRNIDFTEKRGNISVAGVLYTLRVVMDQDG